MVKVGKGKYCLDLRFFLACYEILCSDVYRMNSLEHQNKYCNNECDH